MMLLDVWLCLPDATTVQVGEVVVTGKQPAKNREAVILWLRRLAGRFLNEGTITMRMGSVYKVQGASECIAVSGMGELRGDTVSFRTPCKDANSRTCNTITRMTAASRPEKVRLRVDIELDGVVSISHDVSQTRVKQQAFLPIP
jgi:hypothetical protein